MKKTIWIFNHYATNQFVEHGGRHYYFAKYLIREEYNVIIFCANTIHNSDKLISYDDRLYTEQYCDGIHFVFVKTRLYEGNSKRRVLNMLDYYRNVKHVVKNFVKPDVIIGSSVHPLACVSAIKLSKKYNSKNIVEIRDLWPESIVAYGIADRQNTIIKLLYRLERWIYEKADEIIYTMEGGKDYIIDKGWSISQGGSIDLNKVHHINNGVDLEAFYYNKDNNIIVDEDLESDKYKVIYTGSIRRANNIDLLVNVARELQDRKMDDVAIIVFGDGTEKERLIRQCISDNITNIKFKGEVEKKYIPFILSKADITLLNGVDMVPEYGVSMNKLFDYIASENPILYSSEVNHCLIKRYCLGISGNFANEKEFVDAMLKIKDNISKGENPYKNNSNIVAKKYDYKYLTNELIDIIEQ